MRYARPRRPRPRPDDRTGPRVAAPTTAGSSRKVSTAPRITRPACTALTASPDSAGYWSCGWKGRVRRVHDATRSRWSSVMWMEGSGVPRSRRHPIPLVVGHVDGRVECAAFTAPSDSVGCRSCGWKGRVRRAHGVTRFRWLSVMWMEGRVCRAHGATRSSMRNRRMRSTFARAAARSVSASLPIRASNAARIASFAAPFTAKMNGKPKRLR